MKFFGLFSIFIHKWTLVGLSYELSGMRDEDLFRLFLYEIIGILHISTAWCAMRTNTLGQLMKNATGYMKGAKLFIW